MLLISTMCGCGMLLLCGMVWIAFRLRPGRQVALPAFQPMGGALAGMASVPSTFFAHPRMDFSSGLAPERQTVNLEKRRRRQESSEAQSVTLAHPVPVAFERFTERKKRSQARRCRLDLVYAREAMGDLSDPDVGRLSKPRSTGHLRSPGVDADAHAFLSHRESLQNSSGSQSSYSA